MPDTLKSNTPAWHKRQEVYYHNSLIGSACMIQAQCVKVTQCATVTFPAKDIAAKIHVLAVELEAQLRARRRT
jgi:hypothetical protein